jgi:hypothetical protein
MSLYLLNGGVATESQEIVKGYLSSLGLSKKLEVFVRVL